MGIISPSTIAFCGTSATPLWPSGSSCMAGSGSLPAYQPDIAYPDSAAANAGAIKYVEWRDLVQGRRHDLDPAIPIGEIAVHSPLAGAGGGIFSHTAKIPVYSMSGAKEGFFQVTAKAPMELAARVRETCKTAAGIVKKSIKALNADDAELIKDLVAVSMGDIAGGKIPVLENLLQLSYTIHWRARDRKIHYYEVGVARSQEDNSLFPFESKELIHRSGEHEVVASGRADVEYEEAAAPYEIIEIPAIPREEELEEIVPIEDVIDPPPATAQTFPVELDFMDEDANYPRTIEAENFYYEGFFQVIGVGEGSALVRAIQGQIGFRNDRKISQIKFVRTGDSEAAISIDERSEIRITDKGTIERIEAFLMIHKM